MIFFLARYKKYLLIIFVYLICFFAFTNFMKKQVPDTFFVENHDEEISLNGICFLKIKIKPKFNKSVLASANENSNLKAKAKIFNCIPIKNVNLEVKKRNIAIPCGTPFGIKIFTEGVMVVDVEEKLNKSIKCGDIITKINNQNINSSEEFTEFIENSKGEILNITLERKNITFCVETKASKCENTYKIGLWVIDGSAGLGTITFILHDTKIFTGLGHGIKNKYTGSILPIGNGKIYRVFISSIKKSTKNNVGELKGSIINNNMIGELKINQENGVYGYFQSSSYWPENSKIMPIAFKQEVKTGWAELIFNQEKYKVYIRKITYGNYQNIFIEIMDPRLLKEYGGILRGMSGCPIIQDDRVVGVLTGALNSDPALGFGSFAENLAINCEKLQMYYPGR
ncbi:MAG: SpoIVB peptidase [Candidatus Improbicoccus pseudotrichonymphae]|uniref:SpoIVB peptidase n=1 Tax=Candidatus Improbicoccus pseudotrichonymphae TaxID=3033792 RepID=A0AA48IA11_9FIRM|nr:MAG: SpoIVB peptidase [Candidatus Improbicoccus pseudotrichonymphae]